MASDSFAGSSMPFCGVGDGTPLPGISGDDSCPSAVGTHAAYSDTAPKSQPHVLMAPHRDLLIQFLSVDVATLCAFDSRNGPVVLTGFSWFAREILSVLVYGAHRLTAAQCANEKHDTTLWRSGMLCCKRSIWATVCLAPRLIEVMDEVVEINELTGGMQQPGSISLKCGDTAYRSCAIFKWMVASCRLSAQGTTAGHPG